MKPLAEHRREGLLDLAELRVGEPWAGPLGPRLCRASVPLARHRACQTLTAWAETPSWRAPSAWRTPAQPAQPTGAGGLEPVALLCRRAARDDGMRAILDRLAGQLDVPAPYRASR
jgi:hypothetical protein